MSDKDLYFVLLAKYMIKHNINDETGVFPMFTFQAPVEARLRILIDALNNNILVEETEEYPKYLEGVNFSKSDD